MTPITADIVAVYEYVVVVSTGRSASGKTETFDVLAKRDSAVLGNIRWFGRWRQYTFFPSSETVYSAGCLEDIARFVSRARGTADDPSRVSSSPSKERT